MRLRIAKLFRLQPLARLIGRYSKGLTPWRLRGVRGFAWPRTVRLDVAKKHWGLINQWLHETEKSLSEQGAIVLRGSDFDGWDLEVRGGLAGAARLRLMTEDLLYEAQLLRFRVIPRVSGLAIALSLLCIGLGVLAGMAHHVGFVIAFATLAAIIAAMVVRECGASLATVIRVSENAQEQ
jgi:hypothetical protein